MRTCLKLTAVTAAQAGEVALLLPAQGQEAAVEAVLPRRLHILLLAQALGIPAAPVVLAQRTQVHLLVQAPILLPAAVLEKLL